MARRPAPQPPIALSLLHKVWQPALSIGAILISVTSLVQADRANDLAEKQFEVEQTRQKEQDEKAKREARQVVLADLSDDFRTVRFSITGQDIRLRQVFIEFPPELRMPPIWTDEGRPQEISIEQMEEGLSSVFLPPDHGPLVSPDVLAYVPVMLTAEFSGKGESFSEASIYSIQFRSRLINGRPKLNFESVEPDEQMVGGIKTGEAARILSRCWREYLPGVGAHDAKRSPVDGATLCKRSK